MFSSISDVISRLDSPIGGVVFSALVLFMLAGVYLRWQRNPELSADGRPRRGLLALFALRLITLLIMVLGWLGNISLLELAPTIERSALLGSAVIFAWLWTLDDTSQVRRMLVLFGTAAALGFGIWGLAFWWQNLLVSGYNSLFLNQGWNLLSLPLMVALLWLIYRFSEGQERGGLLQLGLLLAGHTAHYLSADPGGNMPVWVEFAHLAALPLLYFFSLSESRPSNSILESRDGQPAKMRDVDLEAQETGAGEDGEWLGEEVEERGPSKDVLEYAHELAELLDADIVLLGNIDFEAMDIEIEGGFDRRSFAVITPFALLLSQLPRLSSALARRRNLRMDADSGNQELDIIAQALKLGRPLHTWVQPLKSSNGMQEIVILMRADPPWEERDEASLNDIAPPPEKKGRDPGEPKPTVAAGEAEQQDTAAETSLMARLGQLEAENESYRRDVERLLKHVDRLEQKTDSVSEDVVRELREQNQELKDALSSMEAAPQPETPALPPNLIEAEEAKAELRLALQETARVRERLDELEKAIESGEPPPGSTKAIPEEKAEVIASLAQEMRQPLSSILGYTDLLLGESVGILGALQRNFLERVRASTGRMNTLIEDLVKLAELDIAGYEVERKPVDLNGVIDDAINQVREQLQAKQIMLRVDLPRQLPALQSDRDALQQIIYHLLQNADATTPQEGDITLRAFAETSSEAGDYILMQVSDSGGGIPEGDLTRVFSRVYRAQNPVIQGVGDSGVGLTIAETLTEALGGRIWVESEEGVGATFSVLLPLQQSPAETQPS